MAGATPPSPPPEQASSKKKIKKKNVKGSLQWTDSLFSEHPLSILSGSEGGVFFFSLESFFRFCFPGYICCV
jgi:hypothetical protein